MIFTRVLPGLAAGLAWLALGTEPVGAQPGPLDPHPKLHHEMEEVADDSVAAIEGDGHGAASGHGEVNTNPLELREDLAVWTAVVFLLLLLVLWKFAWGPIAQGLQRREQGIADQIAQADRSNLQAKELLAQYQQKLADAKEEVRAMLEKARQDAEKAGRQMIDQAKDEAKVERERAVQQIDTATAAAMKELAGYSADLAVRLAGKIVHAELKPDDHAALIQQTMADFARQSPSSN